MMKVSINAPVGRLTVELEEHQVIEMMRIALDLAESKEDLARDDVMTEERVGSNALALEKQEEVDLVPAPPAVLIDKVDKVNASYRGFLHVKCVACGKIKSFCAKTPLHEYRCACGHSTRLDVLKPLYTRCKCGASFKYMTNLTDEVSSIECIKCGAPVDLEYHDKKGEYHTING